MTIPGHARARHTPGSRARLELAAGVGAVAATGMVLLGLAFYFAFSLCAYGGCSEVRNGPLGIAFWWTALIVLLLWPTVLAALAGSRLPLARGVVASVMALPGALIGIGIAARPLDALVSGIVAGVGVPAAIAMSAPSGRARVFRVRALVAVVLAGSALGHLGVALGLVAHVAVIAAAGAMTLPALAYADTLAARADDVERRGWVRS